MNDEQKTEEKEESADDGAGGGLPAGSLNGAVAVLIILLMMLLAFVADWEWLIAAVILGFDFLVDILGPKKITVKYRLIKFFVYVGVAMLIYTFLDKLYFRIWVFAAPIIWFLIYFHWYRFKLPNKEV